MNPRWSRISPGACECIFYSLRSVEESSSHHNAADVGDELSRAGEPSQLNEIAASKQFHRCWA